LSEGQQIVIRVVNAETVAPQPVKGGATDEQIPDWWNVYEGLTEEEVDRLDKAIRERADLTRHFE
jgi:hypothetical protein